MTIIITNEKNIFVNKSIKFTRQRALLMSAALLMWSNVTTPVDKNLEDEDEEGDDSKDDEESDGSKIDERRGRF